MVDLYQGLSVLGQSRHFGRRPTTSAFALNADIHPCLRMDTSQAWPSAPRADLGDVSVRKCSRCASAQWDISTAREVDGGVGLDVRDLTRCGYKEQRVCSRRPPMIKNSGLLYTGPGRRPTAGASPGCCQIVTRLPSKRMKEKPSKGSRRVARSSRSMAIATSSPSAIEAEASERQ